MRINIWNINGLGESKVKNIANDIQFRNILQTNQIICFTETWRDFNSLLSFNFDENFKEFHYPGYRCHRGGRASGGMSLLIRKSIIDYVEILRSDSYHCWYKLNKAFFNWDLDLFICFVYIPPSTSTLLKSGVSLNFETLQNECASFEDKG